MINTKKWYESKTMIFSILVVVVGILDANISLLKNNLGGFYGYAVIGIGIASGILRLVTKTQIGQK